MCDSDSNSVEFSTSANISSISLNSTISLDDYEGSTASNAPTTQLSNLNIGYNPERDSDTSISNQAIRNQSYKNIDWADGRNSRMSSRSSNSTMHLSGRMFSTSAQDLSVNAKNTTTKDIDALVSILEDSSSSSSSSQPKTTDGQKGSHKSVESSSSYKDSELVQLPSQKRKLLRSASERQQTSPNKLIAIEPHAEVLPANTKITVKTQPKNFVKTDDDDDNDDVDYTPSVKKTIQKTPSSTQLRRSIRCSVRTKTYEENYESQQKHRKNKIALEKERDPSDNIEDEYKTDEDALQPKSAMLYDREADVAGQNLFSFRTPKKKDAMANLAASTPKTPRTPSTPKHRRGLSGSMLSKTPSTPKTTATNRFAANKTPKHVRLINKKGKLEIVMKKIKSNNIT